MWTIQRKILLLENLFFEHDGYNISRLNRSNKEHHCAAAKLMSQVQCWWHRERKCPNLTYRRVEVNISQGPEGGTLLSAYYASSVHHTQ